MAKCRPDVVCFDVGSAAAKARARDRCVLEPTTAALAVARGASPKRLNSGQQRQVRGFRLQPAGAR